MWLSTPSASSLLTEKSVPPQVLHSPHSVPAGSPTPINHSQGLPRTLPAPSPSLPFCPSTSVHTDTSLLKRSSSGPGSFLPGPATKLLLQPTAGHQLKHCQIPELSKEIFPRISHHKQVQDWATRQDNPSDITSAIFQKNPVPCLSLGTSSP